MGISAKNIESHTQLWEILSDMKLTHVAVDLCVLLPSAEEDQFIKLVSLFQKFNTLQALETFNNGDDGVIPLVSGASILSHFPVLIYFVHTPCRSIPMALHDIVTSCKQLKYLWFAGKLKFITTSFSCNLQQLYISIGDRLISNEFMSSISAHGGLEHVVLHVGELTDKGVTELIMNSPNLLTFHAFLYVFTAETFYV